MRDHSAPHALRVLVVDDNVDAAHSLRLVVEMLGHECRAVHIGHDAIVVAEQWRPHVLICDIGLPGGMNGHQVARRFRAHEALKQVHLVALTGWGQEEDRRKALDAGFDLYVAKPLAPDELDVILAGIAARLFK